MHIGLYWSHGAISLHKLNFNRVLIMLAVCVDFKIDLASLDAFLTIMQSAGWLIKNQSSCFRNLTTNLGLNVRKFVLSTLKMLAVSNKLALAEI